MGKFASVFIQLFVLFFASKSCLGGIISLYGSQATQSMTATKRLAPALEKLREGKLEDSRQLASRVVAELGDLPHADVLVAIWLIEKREFNASQLLLEQLSRAEPSRSDVHFAFGELARVSGRTYDAWTHLEVAESLPPPAAWSQQYAADFLNAILLGKSMVAEQREEWSVSRQLLQRAQSLGASSANIEMGLGRAAFHNKEIDNAEKHFRAAALLAPEEIVPEMLLAMLFASQSNSELADAWFTRGAGENKPHSDRIRLAHAMWLLNEQRGAEAFRHSQEATKTETKFKDEFAMVQALVYYMYGKYSEAEGLLSSLAQRNPGNLRIGNQLALALAESTDEGKRARALQLAVQNMKSAPDSVDAASSLAWIQFRLGDIKAAEETATAVLRRGGQLSRDSAYFLAQILTKLNRIKEAESLLEVTRKSNGEFFNAKRLANSSGNKSE